MFDENEVLKDTYIPPQMLNDCYISTDGLIFAPEYDKDGNEVKTAMQFYEEWLERMNRPLPPSSLDILGAQVAQLSISNMQKDQIINALGAQLAQTSLDVIALKSNAGGM